jgi:hypothetical protein
MGYKDKYSGQNWQHGWHAEVVKEIVATRASRIVHSAHKVNWDDPDVVHLTEKIAYAFNNFMRMVSIVISSRVEGRNAWYRAVDIISECGVCCLRPVIADNFADIPVGSSSQILRIVILSDDEVERFNSFNTTVGSHTHILHGVPAGEEFQRVRVLVEKWMSEWFPVK